MVHSQTTKRKGSKGTRAVAWRWLLLALLFAACQEQTSEKAPIHFNSNMDDQAYFESQEANALFAAASDGRAMRPQAMNTIAAGSSAFTQTYVTGGDKNLLTHDEDWVRSDSDYYKGYTVYSDSIKAEGFSCAQNTDCASTSLACSAHKLGNTKISEAQASCAPKCTLPPGSAAKIATGVCKDVCTGADDTTDRCQGCVTSVTTSQLEVQGCNSCRDTAAQNAVAILKRSKDKGLCEPIACDASKPCPDFGDLCVQVANGNNVCKPKEYVAEFPEALISYLSDEASFGQLLERGQERFGIYCAPCHGLNGGEVFGGESVSGTGVVKLRKPDYQIPSYHSDKLRAYPVSRIYDVISSGFQKMPSFAAQISPKDRWAIAAYVRVLQRSRHAELKHIPTNVTQGWKK